MPQNLQANKTNAIAFYQAAFDGNPRQAVADYVGAQYIQHNPLAGDGAEALIEYFERMAREYPEKSIQFVRAVAEPIWSPCTPTSAGPVAMNTSPWIFSASMTKGKSWSIGTPCSKFPRPAPTPTPCTKLRHRDTATPRHRDTAAREPAALSQSVARSCSPWRRRACRQAALPSSNSRQGEGRHS